MHYPNFFSMSQAERPKAMLTDKRVILKSGLYIQNCFLLRTSKLFVRGRTGLVVRASDSGSGDPGSILGRVGVLFP